MSDSNVCETRPEDKTVVAKSDRTKARKKKELRNVEQILKSMHNLDTDGKLQVISRSRKPFREPFN